jgi:hypothetical protein
MEILLLAVVEQAVVVEFLVVQGVQPEQVPLITGGYLVVQ